MYHDNHSIQALIAKVRRQFIWRTLGQYFATWMALSCVLLFSVVWLSPYLGEGVLWWGLALALFIAALLLLLLHQRSRQITDEQLALFIEEHHPSLEDRLNSAVQATGVLDQNILSALVKDALHHVHSMPSRSILKHLRARVWIASSFIIASVCLIGGLTQLDRLQSTSLPEVLPRTPYLAVSPGDVEVDQGETVSIVATLRSETRDDVVLVHQDQSNQWVRQPMVAGKESGAYLAELADVQHSIQYYIEAGRYRTDPFTVSVYHFPEVEQIDATYEFPRYTNLPVRTQNDEGDIEGLIGSSVTVTVHTNHVTEEARLILENGENIPLSKVNSGKFRGKFDLLEEDRYTVELRDDHARQNRFPRAFLITPVEDAGPVITLQEPGRDLRANAIQEVLIAADAIDDYGIRSFDLQYSINGEEEVNIDLLTTADVTEVTGEHLIFLEDYPLEPGDVITYYIEAADALRSEFSDMYFVEIIPFEQQFVQLANAGGGESRGRQGGLVVSQQDIIAATWRLLREQPSDFDQDLKALLQAQRNLQFNIQERLRATAFSLELRGSSDQQKVADYLQSAIHEMEQAIEDLSSERLRASLTPQRRALNQLLKANALNTAQQIARQQQTGSGANATEERMSELMDLELDISKDKYESPRSTPAAEVRAKDNNALRRVRDLADRQQELAQQGPPEQEEDRRRFVDRLQRSQEELQETLDDLLQNRSSGRIQNEMNQAMRNMEEAQRALRRGNTDEASRRQQQAANSLRSLEELLQIQTRGTDRQALDRLREDLNEFIQNEIDLNKSLVSEGDRPSNEALSQLNEDRANSLQDLEEILEQAELLESSDSDAQIVARNLRQEVYRSALREDIQNSQQAIRNGWMPTARRIQDEITEDLVGLEIIAQELSESLPVTEEEQLSRSLEDIVRLRNEVKDLEAQAERMRLDGSASSAQMARLEQQRNKVQETADRLQQRIGDGQPTADEILNSLIRADHTGVLLDEESSIAFFNQDIYAPLSQLETQILEALEAVKLESKLYGSRRGDVPAEYQGLIEKYYESLSRRPSQ